MRNQVMLQLVSTEDTIANIGLLKRFQKITVHFMTFLLLLHLHVQNFCRPAPIAGPVHMRWQELPSWNQPPVGSAGPI